MSNSTEVQSNRAITVPFHGVDLYVVEHNGQPYTPMKAIVQAIGLDWGSQFRKVASNDARWGIVNLTIPTVGGDQAMSCLPIRKTAAWLTTIEPGKVKDPEVRARVVQYQNECDDVLWQYWNEGIAINPRVAYSVNPEDKLTKEEADTLRQLIEGTAKRLFRDTGLQGQFIRGAWSKLKSHFKVSYREIPRQELTEALSIVSRHTTEWEIVDELPVSLTINDQLEKLVYQLNAPNGLPVEVVMPLYDAVNRKMQERGWFRANGLMPDAQAKEVFSRTDRLCQLFHPLSSQFEDVLGITRALRGLDPKHGLKRDDFLQLADQRMLALH